MAQSIGKFAGVDSGFQQVATRYARPVVLGTLGQQQRSAGLDASGLASLLGSQKIRSPRPFRPALPISLSAAGLIDKAAGTCA